MRKKTIKVEKPRVVKDSAYFSMIGRIGGLRTKELAKQRSGSVASYYSNIGTIGGITIRDTKPKDYFSIMGKKARSKHAA